MSDTRKQIVITLPIECEEACREIGRYMRKQYGPWDDFEEGHEVADALEYPSIREVPSE